MLLIKSFINNKHKRVKYVIDGKKMLIIFWSIFDFF